MFTSKGLFSQIPCPHLEDCHLPRCLFSHQPPVTSSLDPTYDTAKNDNTQEGQRKRIKLDQTKEINPPKSSLQSGKVSTGSLGKSAAQPDRPISPPLLKRKPQQPPSSTTPLTPKTQKATLQPTSKTPAKKTEVVQKNEVLNPRNLKGPAPAAYDLRLRLVRALHEHFKRLNAELEKDASEAEEELVLSEQGMIGKALDIEEDAALNPLIYSNVVKNKILVYKRMSAKQWVEERQKEVAAEKLKIATIHAVTPQVKPTGPPKVIDTGLKLEEELKLLPRLYTPITDLSKHGYVSKLPTESEIEQARKGVEAAQGWEVCDRCKSRFQVFPERREEDGALALGGTCTYHYGKPFFPERSVDNPKEKRVKRYRCCGEELGDSIGCTKGENHVFKITEVKRQASILPFMKTPENPERTSDQPVCIDGEMGYTVYGLELIRLTATTWPSGAELFDVLVKPLGGILDLNSRYSGVWPEDFASALPFSPSSNSAVPLSAKQEKLRIVDSPQAARDLLFSYLSPDTPLVGHGLENDLNATRVIHPTIIDTALLYPHKAGLPFRNGLKSLMAFHLNRNIQVVVDGNMQGHDSKEDANAAGDLVRYKLKTEWEKMRRDGWTLHEGTFRPPTPKGKSAGNSTDYCNVTDASPDMNIPTGSRKRSRDETPTKYASLNASSVVHSDQRSVGRPVGSSDSSPALKKKKLKEPSEEGEL